MKKQDLRFWQDRYNRAVAEFDEPVRQMQKNQKQYDGTLQPDRGEEVSCIYNFTKELIESAIDPSVPRPKVEPVIKTERNLLLARTIEAMLVNEAKRINFEPINDIDERTTKVMGGDVAIVEWNNNIKTHNTVGDIDIRLIAPTRFVPQDGVYDLKRMEYIFLDFEDTKDNVKRVYGVDVDDESVDPLRTDSDAEDTVTQTWAFFRNRKGGIGVFSWVGDKVVIDDEEYQARGMYVCESCGISKPVGEDTCSCGGKKWTMRHLDFEELTEDITRSDGSVIPAMDWARNEDGTYKLQDVEVPVMDINPLTGMEEQVYEQVFDERMNIIGDQPMMMIQQQTYQEPTRIPYYTPKTWPVCIRKNVSSEEMVFGESDAEMIFELQDKANKVATKAWKKALGNGQILTKLKTSDFKFSNGMQVLEVNAIDELNAIRSIDMRFDVSADIALINQMYFWAKSLLGINDSSQGKQDTTAQSGRAKEAQISRAQARQASKVVMKNCFYQEIYRAMMEYAFAYMDEPRDYPYQDDSGDDEALIFNRYDFLERDEHGNWYYNDQFIITIDQTGSTAENRQMVLEMMQADFTAGLYGNPRDPEAILTFWKDRESMNYPNAKRQVSRWQKKIEEIKQQQMMLQQQLEAQNQMMMQQMGQMAPPAVSEGDPGGEVDEMFM